MLAELKDLVQKTLFTKVRRIKVPRVHQSFIPLG